MGEQRSCQGHLACIFSSMANSVNIDRQMSEMYDWSIPLSANKIMGGEDPQYQGEAAQLNRWMNFQSTWDGATYGYDEFQDHLMRFSASDSCTPECRQALVGFVYLNLWTYRDDFLEAILPACLPALAAAGSDYDFLKAEIRTYVAELIHRGFELPLTEACMAQYFP